MAGKIRYGLRDIRRWAMLDNEARTREMLKESCVYHSNRSPCVPTIKVVIKVIAKDLFLSMIGAKLLDISKIFKYFNARTTDLQYRSFAE